MLLVVSLIAPLASLDCGPDAVIHGIINTSQGAYTSENWTHYYSPNLAFVGQILSQKPVKEGFEHKINAIIELTTLEYPYMDSLFNHIYGF